MKAKAAEEIAEITEHSKPEDEGGVKHHIAMVLKHGDCDEKAEALVEAMEWCVSNLIGNLLAHKDGMPIKDDKSAVDIHHTMK
jgi:hypothetical protein